RPFPPAKWHLDFAIFPDSFEYFQKLKRIIIKLGYEYRLVLIAPGGIVYDRGAARLSNKRNTPEWSGLIFPLLRRHRGG
ncbi:MAG: hypothetical protein NZ602_07705, partial [Thermoguttaceae bacterium]|nr:hypothetical protein [Thermoguttaceae bacterium]MDW8037519.1 hypothetical protein [Thermoguttaceae bacterium]